MLSRVIIRVVLFLLSFLLVFIASFLIFRDFEIGPISPSPEILILVKNEKPFHVIKQPVTINVEKGKKVQIKVEVYHQGQLLDEGQFTYQWCFDPPVDEELHELHCLNNHYRGATNDDYMPKTLAEQALKITIHHDILQAATVSISFKLE
jgi:hypothetical protein